MVRSTHDIRRDVDKNRLRGEIQNLHEEKTEVERSQVDQSGTDVPTGIATLGNP